MDWQKCRNEIYEIIGGGGGDGQYTVYFVYGRTDTEG